LKSVLTFLFLFVCFWYFINLEVSYINNYLFSFSVIVRNGNSTTPTPLHTFKDLHFRSRVLSYRNDELLNKSGIYAFINIINGKQYIGSSQNLYKRMLYHIADIQSNVLLQHAL
jgi:hypothetical protein